MTTFLLDPNVLIALTVAEHEHHEPAMDWFASTQRFAVCPTVEGALIRFLLRIGESMDTAAAVLSGVRDATKCEFWPDELSYAEVDAAAVRGHRQVTDNYLAALARHREGRMATFDRGLADQHPDVCVLLGR